METVRSNIKNALEQWQAQGNDPEVFMENLKRERRRINDTIALASAALESVPGVSLRSRTLGVALIEKVLEIENGMDFEIDIPCGEYYGDALLQQLQRYIKTPSQKHTNQETA